MQCECFEDMAPCQAEAVARITVPHVAPRTAMCQRHLDEMLEWGERYRSLPGAVITERVD